MRGSVRTLSTAFAITMAAVALAGGTAQAGKFKVLHSFCQNQHRFCGDGSSPQGGLVMDSAGNFYGTTASGGRGFGTAYELERKPRGGFDFKTIYRFCKSGLCGQNPSSKLIIGTSGNLYGTAKNLIFELSPGPDKGIWTEKVLYRFCSQQDCTDGNFPQGGITYAGALTGAPYDGVSPLFGTTAGGGANNQGTVFELTNSGGHWSEAVLYSFCSQGGDACTDGSVPFAPVILDQLGNLYGTTHNGGGNDLGGNGGGAGTVYELSEKAGVWSETILHRFCSADRCEDGAYPLAPLRWDAAGNLLGTTAVGGQKCTLNGKLGCGVLFSLTNQGGNSVETVLYSFCAERNCRDGAEPAATPILDTAGSLFGTTETGGGNNIDRFGTGGGVVYSLSGSSYAVSHHFCSLANCADGEYPDAELTQNEFGSLLGTTRLGGSFGIDNAGGTVFSLRARE